MQAMPYLEKALEYSLAHKQRLAETYVPKCPALKYKRTMDADHAYHGITGEGTVRCHDLNSNYIQIASIQLSTCTSTLTH